MTAHRETAPAASSLRPRRLPVPVGPSRKARLRTGSVGLGMVLLLALLPVVTRADESGHHSQPSEALEELSLEQLLSTRIVSASRASEPLVDAPATVIVITRQEILDRGYTELSEILDDLPGMQVIRPYGATYFKNYWRGYRNTIGDPFLFLVDGIVMNHLYFNTADVMATLPLSNIERIEVVYGPASSVYGANAFMGVINVITRHDAPPAGGRVTVMAAVGSDHARLGDVTWQQSFGRVAVSLAARIDKGNLDREAAQRSEYSRDRYYADPLLWGGFATDARYGGRFSSPRDNRAVDLRLRSGGLELGFMAYRLRSGYGLEYAGDRAQNHGVWDRPDVSAHLRYETKLSPRISSATLLRYRRSDVADDSFWVEGITGADGGRLVQVSGWESRNWSWSLFQDFDISLGSRFTLYTGLKYERKDLQKAYDISYGPALPPASADPATYPFADALPGSAIPNNRLKTDDIGAYVQARLAVADGQHLVLGVRRDHNSRYGGTTTVRSGYVGGIGTWRVKALYGEAYQEPNQRVLYGGWTGSGSDPTLAPERSRTVELSLARTSRNLSGLLSMYQVHDDDTVVNTTSGARNLGARSVIGADLHLQAQLHPGGLRRLRLWGYASHLFRARERVVTAEGADLGTTTIGDLAGTTLWAGVTAEVRERITTTLRGRWVAVRRTVATNPVGRVPSFATVDAVVTVRPSATGPLALSLKVTNLFDERYAHPGVREASAGVAPGFFDAAGQWHGSAGYFSSLLPQPGRAVMLVLGLDLGF